MLFSLECRRHLLLCLLMTLVGHMVHDAAAAEFKLMILHNSDMRSNFDPINEKKQTCTPAEEKAKACYGGFARVAHVVKEAKQKATDNKGPPVLYLNTGDTFQGTIYFTVHDWKVVANITSMLQLDAMALGSHEFDKGMASLVPFINAVPYEVLASNMDVNKEPALKATKLASSFVKKNVGGHDIGIIGYTTKAAKDLSDTGKVFFLDEVQSVLEEAAKLTKEGIKILIVVGNGGFDIDVMIAKEVPEVDLVVGGHSGTFLYTGNPPVTDLKVTGAYPTMVENVNKRKTPVVHAHELTKFLGKVILTFDESGEVKSSHGNPILLDHKIQQDKDVLEALKPWRDLAEENKKIEVGSTRTLINADCRLLECTMGNFITDAAIDYYQKHFPKPERGWSDVSIAMLNGGTLKESIEPTAVQYGKKGVITTYDVYKGAPYQNGFTKIHLPGQQIKEMMEWSVSRYPAEVNTGQLHWGGFLQVSGLRVKYDVCKPVGQRVVSLRVRCNTCDEPLFKTLDPTEEYGIIVSTYLVHGGDGYRIKEFMTDSKVLPVTDQSVLADYINNTSPVYPGLEGRIIITNVCKKKKGGSDAGCCTSNLLVKFSAIVLLATANDFLLN